MGDGAAHAHILGWAPQGVDEKIADPFGRYRQDLQLRVALEHRGVVSVQATRNVGLAGTQIGNARRGIRHGLKSDVSEERRTAPIGLVRLEGNAHALLPAGEPVWSASHRLEIELGIADALDIALRHDAQLDELGQQGWIGLLGAQPHRRRRNDVGRDDAVELAELRALELRIDDALDAVDHVLGRQWRAVMEFHVGADVEVDHRIADIAPRGGDLRHDLAVGIARQQIVENIAVDRVAVGIPLHVRIERRRVGRKIDRKRVLLRLCGDRRREICQRHR